MEADDIVLVRLLNGGHGRVLYDTDLILDGFRFYVGVVEAGWYDFLHAVGDYGLSRKFNIIIVV